tara:strand:- start:3214 stop:4509 length:1296 start_codon:yes stop_codon:yes gene_type:complete
MKFSIKNLDKCRRKLEITIPSDAVIEEKKKAVGVYAKHANIPGFRKGKAPLNVVENKYNKEIINDIKEQLLPRFYQKAIQESEIKVVNIIEYSEINIESDLSAKFDVTIDVYPKFKLPKYTDISVSTKLDLVNDKDIEDQIDNLLNQFSTYEIMNEKKIEAGDMGQLEYEAFIKDKPLREVIPESKGLSSGKDYWVSADEHSFIPDMGHQIIGLSVGDEKEIEIVFPKSFMINELSEKKVNYKIKLQAIKIKIKAELNEELLKKIQVESIDQLKEIFHDQLSQQAKNKELSEKHEQIISYLLKKTKIDVPESSIQQQTREVMYNLARQKMMAGASQDDLSNDQEKLLSEAKEKAIENVKLRFIGLSIADEQNFEATNEEIDQEISQIAIQQRKKADEVKSEMINNHTIESVSDQIKFNKALEFMVEKSKNK